MGRLGALRNEPSCRQREEEREGAGSVGCVYQWIDGWTTWMNEKMNEDILTSVAP